MKRWAAGALLDVAHRRGLVTFRVDHRFLAACQQGVFLYDRGRITRLLRGRYFGVTRGNAPGICYVTEYVRKGGRRGDGPDERSHVYRCRMTGGTLEIAEEVRFHRNGKPEWPIKVHQVRSHQGFLWVANTRRNLVWKATPDGEVVGEWTGSRPFEYDPESPRELTYRVRASTDYHHYNSIAFHDGLVYVLAHNGASKGQARQSFMVTLDSGLREVDRRPDIGRACHDLLFHGADLYICNSGEGALLRNFQPVARTGYYVRGLARIGSMLVMGGSIPRVDPEQRVRSRSRLFFVDLATHRVLHALTLGHVGDVHDILALDDEGE
jgi:hypothetical protein